MPLMINAAAYTDTVNVVGDFLKEFHVFKTSAEHLKRQPVTEVKGRGLLYVNQREYAIVCPDDESVDILGTDDATTCHMLVLRHTGSGVTCLSHCDGCDSKRGIKKMVEGVKQLSLGSPEGRLEVTLVGGFRDPRQESNKLSKEVLGILQAQEAEIHLTVACITDLNDELRNNLHFPVIYGIGVEVKTGRIFPASFPDKSPSISLRSACHFGGVKDLFDIYDRDKHEVVIGPYMWEPWDDVSMWVNLPDPTIRKYLSTSPEQEPPGFEQHVRDALRVLEQHPKPAESLFPGGRPHRFRQQPNGAWTRVEGVS